MAELSKEKRKALEDMVARSIPGLENSSLNPIPMAPAPTAEEPTVKYMWDSAHPWTANESDSGAELSAPLPSYVPPTTPTQLPDIGSVPMGNRDPNDTRGLSELTRDALKDMFTPRKMPTIDWSKAKTQSLPEDATLGQKLTHSYPLKDWVAPLAHGVKDAALAMSSSFGAPHPEALTNIPPGTPVTTSLDTALAQKVGSNLVSAGGEEPQQMINIGNGLMVPASEAPGLAGEGPEGAAIERTTTPMTPGLAKALADSQETLLKGERLTDQALLNLEKAATQESDIINKKAEVVKQLGDAEARVRQDANNEIQQITRAIGERQRELETLEPKDFWADKSTSQKIGIALSVLLGGIGQGLSGAKENAALQALDSAIARDLQKQQETYRRKTASLQLMKDKRTDRRELMRDEIAETAARYGATITQLNTQLEAVKAAATSEDQKMKIANLQLMLEQKANENNIALQQQLAGKVVEKGLVLTKDGQVLMGGKPMKKGVADTAAQVKVQNDLTNQSNWVNQVSMKLDQIDALIKAGDLEGAHGAYTKNTKLFQSFLSRDSVTGRDAELTMPYLTPRGAEVPLAMIKGAGTGIGLGYGLTGGLKAAQGVASDVATGQVTSLPSLGLSLAKNFALSGASALAPLATGAAGAIGMGALSYSQKRGVPGGLNFSPDVVSQQKLMRAELEIAQASTEFLTGISNLMDSGIPYAKALPLARGAIERKYGKDSKTTTQAIDSSLTLKPTTGD